MSPPLSEAEHTMFRTMRGIYELSKKKKLEFFEYTFLNTLVYYIRPRDTIAVCCWVGILSLLQMVMEFLVNVARW